jgi:hypothetical protein
MFSSLGFQSLNIPRPLGVLQCRMLIPRAGWRLHQGEQLDVSRRISDPYKISLRAPRENNQQFKERIDIGSWLEDDIEASAYRSSESAWLKI